MEQLASKSIKEVLSEPEGQQLAQVTNSDVTCTSIESARQRPTRTETTAV